MITFGNLPAKKFYVGNQKVKSIWNGNTKVFNAAYAITCSVTHGTAAGDTELDPDGIALITITPDDGYKLPETITVTNADYDYDEYSGVITLSNPTDNVIISAVCEEEPTITTFNETPWNLISSVSDIGANYFAVGDRKAVAISGTVGTQAINTTLYVYILGFNHNSAIEGTGISCGCFMTALSGGKNVALCDSHYNNDSTNSSKWFNINHSSNTNSGGWKNSSVRYDILGSVEAKNRQNATSAAKSSPVANTLMAALPSDLRAVMKPITKYTDNVGGGTDTAANVTTTIDYLPLLAEYEIFGVKTNANSTEQTFQKQYAYYVNGNFITKYNHRDINTTVNWWMRSPYTGTAVQFTRVGIYAVSTYYTTSRSGGIAPVFLV